MLKYCTISIILSLKHILNHKYMYTGGGMDYDSRPYNITFPAGTTSVPFNVSITDDNILEDNENFFLTVDLSSLPDNITASDPYQATVTIVDKDGKLTVVAEFRYYVYRSSSKFAIFIPVSYL